MNYKEIIDAYPPIPDKDQLRMLGGTKTEKDRVLLGYGKTIIKLARRYIRQDHELEDVFQQAWLGLLHAAKLYDPTKNIKPITYFTWWILEKIRKYAQDNRLITLPNLPWKLLNTYHKLRESLEHDIAIQQMSLTPKRQTLLLQAIRRVTPIQTKPSSTTQEQTEYLFDEKQDVITNLLEKEFDDLVKDKIDHVLNSEERQVLALRREGLSRREVAEIIDVEDKEVLRIESTIKRLVRL